VFCHNTLVGVLDREKRKGSKSCFYLLGIVSFIIFFLLVINEYGIFYMCYVQYRGVTLYAHHIYIIILEEYIIIINTLASYY